MKRLPRWMASLHVKTLLTPDPHHQTCQPWNSATMPQAKTCRTCRQWSISRNKPAAGWRQLARTIEGVPTKAADRQPPTGAFSPTGQQQLALHAAHAAGRLRETHGEGSSFLPVETRPSPAVTSLTLPATTTLPTKCSARVVSKKGGRVNLPVRAVDLHGAMRVLELQKHGRKEIVSKWPYYKSHLPSLLPYICLQKIPCLPFFASR